MSLKGQGNGLDVCDSHNKKSHTPVCFDSGEDCPVCDALDQVDILTDEVADNEETIKNLNKDIVKLGDVLGDLCPTCATVKELSDER